MTQIDPDSKKLDFQTSRDKIYYSVLFFTYKIKAVKKSVIASVNLHIFHVASALFTQKANGRALINIKLNVVFILNYLLSIRTRIFARPFLRNIVSVESYNCLNSVKLIHSRKLRHFPLILHPLPPSLTRLPLATPLLTPKHAIFCSNQWIRLLY